MLPHVGARAPFRKSRIRSEFSDAVTTESTMHAWEPRNHWNAISELPKYRSYKEWALSVLEPHKCAKDVLDQQTALGNPLDVPAEELSSMFRVGRVWNVRKRITRCLFIFVTIENLAKSVDSRKKEYFLAVTTVALGSGFPLGTLLVQMLSFPERSQHLQRRSLKNTWSRSQDLDTFCFRDTLEALVNVALTQKGSILLLWDSRVSKR